MPNLYLHIRHNRHQSTSDSSPHFIIYLHILHKTKNPAAQYFLELLTTCFFSGVFCGTVTLLVTKGLKLSIISNCFTGEVVSVCLALLGEGLGRGREGISAAVTGGLGRCSDSLIASSFNATLPEIRTLLSENRKE